MCFADVALPVSCYVSLFLSTFGRVCSLFTFPYPLRRCVVLSWFVLFIWIFRERVPGEIWAPRISAKGNERFVHSHYISLLLCVCLGIWPPHLSFGPFNVVDGCCSCRRS